MNRTLFILSLWGISAAALGQSSSIELERLLEVWRSDSLELDERLAAFNEGYAQFHQAFPNVFLVELDTLLMLSRTTDQPLLEYEAHLRRGGLLNYRGQNDQALEAYDRAEEVALSLGDSLRLGSVKKNRGIAHATSQQYIEALEHFSSAVTCYRAVGDSARACEVGMALGSVFALLGDHVLAKAHYQQMADEMPKRPEYDRLKCLLDLNLGWSEYKLKEHESALALSLSALDGLRQYNSGFHIAGCLTNLARIHLDMGSLELAMAYADSGRTQSEAIGAVEDLLSCELMRADIERQTGTPQQALKHLELIAHQIESQKNVEVYEEFHRIKYEAFKDLGNASKALSAHEQFQFYHDSVQVQTNSFAIARAAYEKDTQHQVRLVEMAAERRRDRQRLAQLRLVLGLILGFGLVVAMLVALILRMRTMEENKRQNLLDEIQELKSSARHMANPHFDSLDRERLEQSIGRTLNETDWKVLSLLLENPTITNVKLAEFAHLSVDGIGSSLRRMYGFFNVQETKYKKIALLHSVITLSKEGGQVHPQA
ncbi:MAG: winged helix-turn-helix transcriptional regulator [Flavobacteriales bacterium]